MNCHGYSTGRNTWMYLEPALNDDYDPSNNLDDLASGAIFANPNTISITVLNSVFQVGGHSARIEDIKPPMTAQNGDKHVPVTVYEKNRVSAVYKKKISIIWEKQANGSYKMLYVSLPWSTFTHFHVKQ